MKNSFRSEIAVSFMLLILTVLLLNPLGFWMPQEAHMGVTIAVVVFFTLFASFVWKEKSVDEREILHRNISGRMAYLAGTSIAIIGVVIQSLKHTLDVWLVLTLVAMVLGKVTGLVYGKIKK
ncbi:hypothetical protein A3G67_00405 [Candidatus Roizmanbacteria bacterium RIFCSPLOWO2_12_FULL_40_12]|nr:MAG: hypothetical protein A2W49_04450 [Candidatus Roizmanbacteria bacterium RIFCSPHIGHO2_12_41_18]OGK58926.1 MAG: hypothetical protein A3H84_04350 [Candidatus Roizmanbacteria bacterium RIFCSPLOWO2_02_FULL_40_13]OGK61236.1 MAG: hypothetical protein A3G67_00405 [Candidatus Roizmanbacteria bacterium RIFCSPLOWO2_12_FULL_40_12]